VLESSSGTMSSTQQRRARERESSDREGGEFNRKIFWMKVTAFTLSKEMLESDEENHFGRGRA
jgi:hypothetical protein